MEAFVTGLHVILCLFLILVVLLQPGKGADFGAMMGGSTGQTGSAAQGATLIGKLTAVVAALFMVTSMALAWFSNQGQTSVMSDEGLEQELKAQEAEATDKATPDEAPAQEEAPAPDEAPAPEEAPAPDEAPAPEAGGAAPEDGAGDADGEAPGGDAAPAGGDATEGDAAPEGAAPAADAPE